MAYMSDWIYSEQDMKDRVSEERENIYNEVKQSIKNGIIKINSGSEALFKIIKGDN